MSQPYVLKKSYTNHYGLDLKSSDLIRPDGFASGLLNAQLAKNGDIEKRKGYHCYAPETDIDGDKVGGFGLYVFNRNYALDIGSTVFSGQRNTQILACGRYLHKLNTASIKIVYSGTSNSIFLSIFFDPSSKTYKFQIYDATTDTYLANIDLGTGFETTPMTISMLISSLSLGGSFTVTSTNELYGIAAFLKPVRFFDLFSAGSIGCTSITGFWKKVESSRTYPFNGTWERKDSDVVENVSAVEMNNLMYFSNGYDPMMKHDGTYLYKAGLPTPASFTLSLGSLAPSTFIANRYYSFKYNYRNTDNSLIDTDSNVLTSTFHYNPSVYVTMFGAVTSSYTIQLPASAIPPSGTALSVGDKIQFTDVTGGVDTIVFATVASFGPGANDVNLVPSSVVNAETGVSFGPVTTSTAAGKNSVYRQYAINAVLPNLQSDYNVRYIQSNASGTGTTSIPVASGGTRFSLGDVIYFYDLDHFAYVRAIVESSTNTQINISEITDLFTNQSYANCGYANGVTITCGLFHILWRTAGFATKEEAESALYYYDQIVPNIPTIASVTYPLLGFYTAENTATELFVEPPVTRDLPPKMKYISVHRNQLVGCGDPDNLKSVHFSDIESPEWFPAGRSSLDVETYVGDEMSGIAPNNNVLVIFKQRSIHTISGDLTTLAVRVDPLVNDIGCASHQTIRDVRGELYFQTDRGPYKMIGGQVPAPVSDSRIEPIFVQESVTDEEKYQLKRCYAFNDRIGEKYILFIPAETQAVIGKRNNAYSRCFAIDYYRGDAIFEWSNFDISSGAIEADGEIFFQGRTTDKTDTSKVRTYLFRRMNLNDAWDYQDNIIPIEWEYDSNWEALGDPSVYKRFLKIRIFSINSLPNNDLFLNIKSEINYIKDSSKADITFSFPNAGYGVSSYGYSSYGSQREQAIYKKLNTERVRSMRIRFSNNKDQQNVALTGWELEISTTYKPAFKR